MADNDRVYISEAAELLNRQMDTLRKLDVDGDGGFPDHLRPKRGYRNWRYWTEGQIKELEEWFSNRQPGWPGAERTQDEVDLHLERMRKPRLRKET